MIVVLTIVTEISSEEVNRDHIYTNSITCIR